MQAAAEEESKAHSWALLRSPAVRGELQVGQPLRPVVVSILVCHALVVLGALISQCSSRDSPSLSGQKGILGSMPFGFGMPCTSASGLLPQAPITLAERHTDCVSHAYSVWLPQEARSVLAERHRLFVILCMRGWCKGWAVSHFEVAKGTFPRMAKTGLMLARKVLECIAFWCCQRGSFAYIDDAELANALILVSCKQASQLCAVDHCPTSTQSHQLQLCCLAEGQAR